MQALAGGWQVLAGGDDDAGWRMECAYWLEDGKQASSGGGESWLVDGVQVSRCKFWWFLVLGM